MTLNREEKRISGAKTRITLLQARQAKSDKLYQLRLKAWEDGKAKRVKEIEYHEKLTVTW